MEKFMAEQTAPLEHRFGSEKRERARIDKLIEKHRSNPSFCCLPDYYGAEIQKGLDRTFSTVSRSRSGASTRR
jgi:hypothetical protein